MHFHLPPVFRIMLRVGAFAALIAFAGCASGPRAPVVDLSTGATPSEPAALESSVKSQEQADSYRVVAGDTLYSIAFRHGLDYRQLARWNAIASPYRIGIGQILRLHPQETAQIAQPAPGVAVTQAAPDRSVAANVTALTVATVQPPPVRHTVPTSQQSPTTAHPPPAVSVPAIPVKPVVQTPPVATVVEQQPAAKPAPKVAELNAGGVTWRWPSDGKVIGTFVDGDQTRQGLDIAGKAGDPVRAAAGGEVVYSGNGLIGYGELIIVKHNSSFLSAYGHNSKRLVKEGQHVAAGQQIAQMGSTASARDELHFEIRKFGKPVNPLDYLPAR